MRAGREFVDQCLGQVRVYAGSFSKNEPCYPNQCQLLLAIRGQEEWRRTEGFVVAHAAVGEVRREVEHDRALAPVCVRVLRERARLAQEVVELWQEVVVSEGPP